MGWPPRRPLMDRTSVPTTARRLPWRHRLRTPRAVAVQSMKSVLYGAARSREIPDACRSSDSAKRRLDRNPTSRRFVDMDGLDDGTPCATPCQQAAVTVLKPTPDHLYKAYG